MKKSTYDNTFLFSTPDTRLWMPTDSTNSLYIWLFFYSALIFSFFLLFLFLPGVRASKVCIYLVYHANAVVEHPRKFLFMIWKENRLDKNGEWITITITITATIPAKPTTQYEKFRAASTNRTIFNDAYLLMRKWCVLVVFLFMYHSICLGLTAYFVLRARKVERSSFSVE